MAGAHGTPDLDRSPRWDQPHAVVVAPSSAVVVAPSSAPAQAPAPMPRLHRHRRGHHRDAVLSAAHGAASSAHRPDRASSPPLLAVGSRAPSAAGATDDAVAAGAIAAETAAVAGTAVPAAPARSTPWRWHDARRRRNIRGHHTSTSPPRFVPRFASYCLLSAPLGTCWSTTIDIEPYHRDAIY